MPPVNLISSTGSSLLDQNTEILQHEADIPSLHLLHQTSSIKTSLSMLSTLKRQLFTGNSKPDAEPVQNDLKPLPSEEKSIQQSHNDLTAHSVEDANTVKIKRFHLSPSSEYVDSVRQYSADGGSNAASKTSSDVPNALRSSKYYNSQADLQNSKFTWLSSRPTSEDVSATVSPGNRQVTTTNNHHCGVNASAIGNPSDDDVSLELSIGPAKRMPTTHLTKSIEAIRSKDRSGFSKWSRAELDSEGADCRPGQTSLCNSGGCEIQEESNDRGNFCKCSTFLRLAQDPAMSLTSNTKNRSMAPECTLLAAGQHSNEPITPYFVRWINSGTLGQWPSRERNIPVASQATITNKLLEAAFGPCEVATKMCKLNNSDHVRVHYLQRDDVTANIDTLNSSGNFGKSEEWTYITDQSKNFQTTDHVKCEADCVQNKTRSSKGAKRLRYHVKLGMPCNIRRSLELPNVVQEKTLVEFLQAKKQQKEHFLDKVVVKEDVYQSHPWHFTSGKPVPVGLLAIPMLTIHSFFSREELK
ncbi:hypothetical protein KP509_11G010100 [Ceratopteris richardii]|uniref:Uncharacterized protein n=1 Tax=Ceratopteris richardii TaxID=49495 RepID=A0A8T2TRU5_CERRI|nr:hypothetical protein KP509_11G010100 [Ceratopteris richardii]